MLLRAGDVGSGDATRLLPVSQALFPAALAKILDGVLEHAQSVARLGLHAAPRPLRMLRRLDVAFGMGHQAANAARRIA